MSKVEEANSPKNELPNIAMFKVQSISILGILLKRVKEKRSKSEKMYTEL